MMVPPSLIGLSAPTVLGASLIELIDVAGRHGFAHISIRPFLYAQALAEGISDTELQRRMADAGVTATMLETYTRALPGVPPVEELDSSIRSMLPGDLVDAPDETTSLRSAVVLGAPLVNVTHYLGTPVPMGELAEAVAAVCRQVALAGRRVAIEFVPDTGIPDLATAQALVEMCGEPNCTLTLDLFHFDRAGGTADDIRRLPPDAIGVVQISDRIRNVGPHVPFQGRCLPGDGELPLVEWVTAALQNSPTAPIMVEVLNEELRSLTPDGVARRVADAVARWHATF